jgi:hypothetical protein
MIPESVVSSLRETSKEAFSSRDVITAFDFQSSSHERSNAKSRPGQGKIGRKLCAIDPGAGLKMTKRVATRARNCLVYGEEDRDRGNAFPK